jgi:hypothetical protein
VTSKVFWPGVVVGWAVIAVGLVGVASEGRDVPVVAFGRWVIGLALIHDLVLVPVVLAIGIGIGRVVPGRWRAHLGVVLVVAGPVLLLAWPFAMGWGASRSNPTILPRDYRSGLLVLLAVIVGVGAVLSVATPARRARPACPEPPAPSLEPSP